MQSDRPVLIAALAALVLVGLGIWFGGTRPTPRIEPSSVVETPIKPAEFKPDPRIRALRSKLARERAAGAAADDAPVGDAPADDAPADAE